MNLLGQVYVHELLQLVLAKLLHTDFLAYEEIVGLVQGKITVGIVEENVLVTFLAKGNPVTVLVHTWYLVVLVYARTRRKNDRGRGRTLVADYHGMTGLLIRMLGKLVDNGVELGLHVLCLLGVAYVGIVDIRTGMVTHYRLVGGVNVPLDNLHNLGILPQLPLPIGDKGHVLLADTGGKTLPQHQKT